MQKCLLKFRPLGAESLESWWLPLGLSRSVSFSPTLGEATAFWDCYRMRSWTAQRWPWFLNPVCGVPGISVSTNEKMTRHKLVQFRSWHAGLQAACECGKDHLLWIHWMFMSVIHVSQNPSSRVGFWSQTSLLLVKKERKWSRSVVSDSLWPHGL